MRINYILLLTFFWMISCYGKSTAFYPGKTWLDQDGEPINAHGGQIIKVNNQYYWIGENRVAGRKNTGKINEYSSNDLYNWKYEGVILDLSRTPRKISIERPKIIFNKKNNNFVMWFHLELDGKYRTAKAGVATSKSIKGPFTMIDQFWPNAGVLPISTQYSLSANNLENNIIDAESKFENQILKGNVLRDMTAFVDDDQKAYIIYASDGNKSIQIAELDENYTNFTGRYIRILVGEMNEAPTLLKHNNKYYLITSGVNGFGPSSARLAVSEKILGSWKSIGSPIKDPSHINMRTTFHSQGTFIFKINLRNNSQYIFLADRWDPKNLNKSTYVWLPLTFENNQPTIRWYDEWHY
ncbi:glycoside hydrolase family 43 protein [Klebsiella oxytoca]|uniref:glycoside hydrolase family 43 protein n=1 Tax=Klebsiella oxytoca TaxID=571 RepID=UPI00292CF248|nr:glycoside hydrolase family 43 protein [Klebsiella oxytoca]